MATKPKATKPATQPVAQPVPAVQNSTATQSTPLVFIQSGKVVAVTQKQLDEFAQAEAKHNPHPVTYLNARDVEDAVAVAEWKLLKAQADAKAKAEANAQADAQAQNEKEFAQSQRAMKRQPKHIQALGRSLWKLWG